MAPKLKKSAGLLRAHSVFASECHHRNSVRTSCFDALTDSLQGDASVDGKVSDVVSARSEQVAKWVIFFGALVLGLQWLVKVSLHSKTVPESSKAWGQKSRE